MSYSPSQLLQKTAFGELQVANAYPVVQADAVYGLRDTVRSIVTGGGTVIAQNSNYICSTSTTTSSTSSAFTGRSVVYKAGQGAEVRFTALFTAEAGENTKQFAGFLNATDGFIFGYIGNEFGVIHRYNGSQEIQELEITTPAGGSENATVTINGTGYTVPLTSGTAADNAIEVADSLTSQVPIYNFQAIEQYVVCRSLFAAPQTGAFTFSSSSAAGTFTEIADGTSVSEDFVALDDFNGGQDFTRWNRDGTAFDPTKGNVYRISYQYLGYGVINFLVEDPKKGEFVLAHRVEYPNTETTPHVSNPTFRAGWSSQNNADASDVIVKGASVAMFNQGNRILTEPARIARNDVNTSTTEIPVFSIRNREVFGEKVNLSPIVPELLYGFTEGTRGADIRVYRNATLTGALFEYVDKDESIALIDKDATAFSGGDEEGSLLVSNIAGAPLDLSRFNLEILPGETLTVTIQQLRGANADCSASLSYQEDV